MDMKRYYYLKRITDSNIDQKPYDIIPIKNEEIVIGREIIKSQLISRRHARITQESGEWTITDLSLNGVLVNEELIAKGAPRTIRVGDVIQFGQPAQFVYKFGVKVVPVAGPSAGPSSSKRVKTLDNTHVRPSRHMKLSQDHAELEQKLKESQAVQTSIKEERDKVQRKLDDQKKLLKERFEHDEQELETQYMSGALEQQGLHMAKEMLAKRLNDQVTQLQEQLEEKQRQLEDKLKTEEEKRAHILQEKESVLSQLQDKIKQEEVMLEERSRLEAQLQQTEGVRERLQQQVEAKDHEIKMKEEQQKRYEEERREATEALMEEKEKMQSELRQKLETMAKDMEKSSEEQRREITSQLHKLQAEKQGLEEQLLLTHAQDRAEMSELHENLQTLEAQKLSLEQELRSISVASANARREVVSSVSDVLEDELQCPICNEMFITAVMLSCSHTFCKYCIDTWKKNKRECPSCRQPIRSETRNLVLDSLIEKMAATLSQEMKDSRARVVEERKAEMAAADERQRQQQAERDAQANARRGRGRGGRRGARAPRRTTAQRQATGTNSTRGSAGRGRGGNTTEPEVYVLEHPAPQATTETVTVSSDSSSSNSESNGSDSLDDSSSDEGLPDAYYGGYGYCYNCGRRGHWANGCPW